MTTPEVTVVVPCGLYHLDVIARAIRSVNAQTVKCAVIPVLDEHGRGAGYARNRGLERVQTEYTVFLDADDELLPTFVERCLPVAKRTKRYVYSDFTDTNGVRYHTSDCPWTDEKWHVVTTLMPTDWWRRVKGFDEQMPYAEDTEAYAHLTRSGYCGIRVPEILMVYHKGGKRSQQGKDKGLRERIMKEINQKYGVKVMGCCGDGAPKVPFAADQLMTVQPTWGMGKRTFRGTATGHVYGRIDSSYTIQIDPRDYARRPDLFKVIEMPAPTVELKAAAKTPSSFQGFVGGLMNAWFPPTVAGVPPEAVTPVDATPNVAKLVDWGTLAFEAEQRKRTPITAAPAVHIQRDPVFVFPDKDYQSYTDVRRLVELSGFDAVREHECVYNRDERYIFLSPEQPSSLPSLDIQSHLTWWSLEYGGEYEPNLSDWRGDVWASDPAWAAAHDARLVVMGSHPDLAPSINDVALNAERYDYLMLAYMTARRAAIGQRLSDLTHPSVAYPGYGLERDEQLFNSRLMLHVHQRDDTAAIAPQRIALCAAYSLPLVAERVPDASVYADYVRFEDYDMLPAAVRDELSGALADPLRTSRGRRLHEWLCREHTFERAVREALK